MQMTDAFVPWRGYFYVDEELWAVEVIRDMILADEAPTVVWLMRVERHPTPLRFQLRHVNSPMRELVYGELPWN